MESKGELAYVLQKPVVHVTTAAPPRRRRRYGGGGGGGFEQQVRPWPFPQQPGDGHQYNNNTGLAAARRDADESGPAPEATRGVRLPTYSRNYRRDRLSLATDAPTTERERTSATSTRFYARTGARGVPPPERRGARRRRRIVPTAPESRRPAVRRTSPRARFPGPRPAPSRAPVCFSVFGFPSPIIRPPACFGRHRSYCHDSCRRAHAQVFLIILFLFFKVLDMPFDLATSL